MACRSTLFFEGHNKPEGSSYSLKGSEREGGTLGGKDSANGDGDTGDAARADSSHLPVSSSIYQFFKEQKFSDFSIVTSDDKVIHVHRCVLASESSYFYSLFSCNFAESLSNCLRFTDITEARLLPILKQMYDNDLYTNTANLSEKNLEDMMIIADRLDAQKLVEKFTKAFFKHVQEDNALTKLKFAREFNLLSLAEYCRRVITPSIKTQSEKPEFGRLLDDDLEYLLLSDEVICDSEQHVLALICQWADYDLEARKDSTLWLLFSLRYKYPRKTNFRIDCLSRFIPKFNYLIEKFDQIVDDVERLDRLLKDASRTDVDESICAILKDHMRKTKQNPAVRCQATKMCWGANYPWFQKQLMPRAARELVFLFGGWSGKYPSNLVQVLNPITYQWTVTTLTMPEMRIYYAAAEIDGVIYIVGGFDNTSRGLKSTWAFEPITEVWTQKQSMFESRCYASSVVYEGKIVVMGGYDDATSPYFIDADYNDSQGGKRFKSVEMYNPEFDKWQRCRDMNHVRSDAASVIYKGYIYVIGGFTGREIHQSVERLNPRYLNQPRLSKANHHMYGQELDWTEVAPMKHQRSGVSCEVCGDFIYAVGGYNGDIQLDSIERYYCFLSSNPNMGIWEEVASMRVPRSNMGLLTINGRVVIVGGYGNDYTTQSCEEFNPETMNSVEIDDLPLPDGCSGIKLVVTRGLHIANRWLSAPDHERVTNNEKLTSSMETRNQSLSENDNRIGNGVRFIPSLNQDPTDYPTLVMPENIRRALS